MLFMFTKKTSCKTIVAVKLPCDISRIFAPARVFLFVIDARSSVALRHFDKAYSSEIKDYRY